MYDKCFYFAYGTIVIIIVYHNKNNSYNYNDTVIIPLCLL